MAEISENFKALSLDERYLLVAAVDLGTAYSGYAYSFKAKARDIYMNHNWGSDLGLMSYKAPTCVLTNPDGTFNSFGYDAEKTFSQLDPTEEGMRIGGPTGYNLFRQFKMLLHKKV